MKNVPIFEKPIITQRIEMQHKRSGSIYKLSKDYCYQGLSAKLYDELVIFLNKQIPRDNREQEKFEIEILVDISEKVMELRIVFQHLAGTDFFQDQKCELYIKQLQNVLPVVSMVLNELGGEIHRAVFYCENNTPALAKDFAYKLNNEKEVELAEFLINNVFSKARRHETLQLYIGEQEFELNVSTISNPAFVADKTETFKRKVDGLIQYKKTVTLMDHDTNRTVTFNYDPKLQDKLKALLNNGKIAEFRYQPNLKNKLGETIECGGRIEEVFEVEEELLL